ncbi:MAG: type II toxin-antitoxin system Phd/YefM family antitoxin [Thermoanaerobaculia bacterium]
MKGPTYSTYEAKARFSEILRQVRGGNSVFITYRGTEVAEIRPIASREGIEERLKRLERGRVLLPATEGSPPGHAIEPVAVRPGALERFLESREYRTPPTPGTPNAPVEVSEPGEPGEQGE